MPFIGITEVLGGKLSAARIEYDWTPFTSKSGKKAYKQTERIWAVYGAREDERVELLNEETKMLL